jgi:hypothetical protein
MARIVLTPSQLATLRLIARSADDRELTIDASEAERLCDLELAEAVPGTRRYVLTVWGRTALKDHGK